MEANRKERILTNRLNNCIEEMNVLEKENSLLATQVSHLENNACKNCAYSRDNISKKIDQVGQRQRQRKIKELKTKAEQALWFFGSYGVSLSTICVEDSHGNQLDISPGKTGGEKVSKYNLLPEKEKTRLKEVIYILDPFCVGDAA